jgi:hypothetical protein
MALSDSPPTRNTTYAALSQVKSADLNALQDAIIQDAHGSVSRWVNLQAIKDGSSGSPENTLRAAVNPSFFYFNGGNGARLRHILPLKVGEKLTQVDFHLYDNDAVATLNAYVTTTAVGDGASPPGSDGYISSLATGAGSSALIQVLTTGAISVVASATLLAAVEVSLTGTPSADTDLRIYGIRYTSELAVV